MDANADHTVETRTRQGMPWTEEEDAQLIREIGAGHQERSLAAFHGRSVNAIRARAVRMIPVQERVTRTEAVDWLCRRLDATPDYDWHAALAARGRSASTNPSQPAHAADATTSERVAPAASDTNAAPPSPAASVQRVLETWESITNQPLSVRHRTEFLNRKAAAVLADYAHDVLTAAGRQLWQRLRRLRLDEWVLECQWPGLAGLSVTATDVADGRPEVAITLHEILSAAVAETPRERDRTVLIRRLGLATAAPETLQSIGDDLGVSRERVRQLQHRALKRLATRPRTVARGREHAQVVLTELAQHPPTGGLAVLLFELAEAVLPRVALSLSVDVLARLLGYTTSDSRRHLHAEVLTLARTQRRHTTAQQRRQRTQARLDNTVDTLLQRAEWPTEPPVATEAIGLHRLREPAEHDHDDNRRWYSPKLDRAVSYESQAELDLIRLLDQSNHISDFCEQPLALGYTLDGTRHTYYSRPARPHPGRHERAHRSQRNPHRGSTVGQPSQVRHRAASLPAQRLGIPRHRRQAPHTTAPARPTRRPRRRRTAGPPPRPERAQMARRAPDAAPPQRHDHRHRRSRAPTRVAITTQPLALVPLYLRPRLNMLTHLQARSLEFRRPTVTMTPAWKIITV